MGSPPSKTWGSGGLCEPATFVLPQPGTLRRGEHPAPRDVYLYSLLQGKPRGRTYREARTRPIAFQAANRTAFASSLSMGPSPVTFPSVTGTHPQLRHFPLASRGKWSSVLPPDRSVRPWVSRFWRNATVTTDAPLLYYFLSADGYRASTRGVNDFRLRGLECNSWVFSSLSASATCSLLC